MREFKFRVWQKNEKIMYISPSEKRHLGRWFDVHCNSAYDNENDCIFMQFTGIYDKNQNPVYEGDILKYKDNNDEDLIGVAQYKPTMFYLQRNGRQPLLVGHGYFLPMSIEVIGNIYENKELLNENSL